MLTCTAERLWKEVVYVAYYLHWPLADILDLEHPAFFFNDTATTEIYTEMRDRTSDRET